MSSQLKLLYILIVSYSTIGQRRGDSPDPRCGNMSLYIHHTNEINVRISLSASSEEACSRWLSSAKKVSGDAGKQSECVAGLFWCLSLVANKCYMYQNMYGLCEGDMITFVAQLESDSSQEPCKGVHEPPPADCWNGVSIDKDCTGPFNRSVVTPFCIPHSDVPYPDVPLSPANLVVWIIISVVIAAFVIALILVAVVTVVVMCRKKARRPREEDESLLRETPPGSLQRQVEYGAGMTNPAVGGAQIGDTIRGNKHQKLLSSHTQSLLSRDSLQLSLNSDQVVGFQE